MELSKSVSFELAKLLKNEGFDKQCNGCYDEKGTYSFTIMSIKQFYANSKEDTWNFAAPIIADVVDYIYENYGIWISADFDGKNWFEVITFIKEDNRVVQNTYDNPHEAYEAAIKYVLETKTTNFE